LEIPLGAQSHRSMGKRYDPETIPLTTGGVVSVSVEIQGSTLAEISEELLMYPTLTNAFVLNEQGKRAQSDDEVNRWNHMGGEQINVAIECPEQTTMADFWQRQRGLVSFVEVDERQPRYPDPHFVGFALPTIANGPSPYPLMLWWALLLGLSSLARYEPGIWTSAIDPDTSQLAVSLERVLDVASERVPKRILAHLQECSV
jgi:hypothetical protein